MMNALRDHAERAPSSRGGRGSTGRRGTILFDRSNPVHVRELARGLAQASGLEWESLTLLEIACWLRRACALADTLAVGPWHGWAC
jgi:hypothetical protein